MKINERIDIIVKAGETVNLFLNSFFDDQEHPFKQVLNKAYQHNKWFTVSNQKMALQHLMSLLDEKQLKNWVSRYPGLTGEKHKPKTIGIVMAGNIPMVGFHDLLCVLLSGNRALIKLSSDDQVLIPYFCQLLTELNPAFSQLITFTNRLSHMDAVIATGSDNSARYFDYYFGKYPNLIRKNRNAVAILTGKETVEELEKLGSDIFSYFGMGCRNVSMLYLPKGYDFNTFFPALEKFAYLMEHARYMSNYDYNSAILLLKKIPFLTNNFLIVMEDKGYATPVAVLHYAFYDELSEVVGDIKQRDDQVQCIVSNAIAGLPTLPFGTSQLPGLTDYADGVDVMKFLEMLD